MPVLKIKETKNLWEEICHEFAKKRSVQDKKDDIQEFDPSKHSAVFYGFSFDKNILDDESLIKDVDASASHPACFGYSLEKFMPKSSLNNSKTSTKDKNECTEREFIESFVFPTLLPALEQMLCEAKSHKCFERKRTAFNACDFLTTFLYQNNPFVDETEAQTRKSITLNEIPFAKEWLELHPRPPLPKSLIWTEEEAVLKLQAFYRGYVVRRDPEVQELRQWQKELREENQNINQRVEKFWSDETKI
ncbi:IQ domain-containing K [Brachionus plicatilis]|uniref:IQ domain-containing K n=1 Tax=Brachionus plicatilis TaxID=10195 RepID=A0A3M7RXN8_BRAPC|nr:IQ domain-containing K [Brachionus plicatilis]